MDTSGRTIDSVPPRRHPRPPLAHGVAHRLSVGRGADPLPSRLPPHRRPQPDPRECPRTGRHAPDRAQEPRHLRPLQHYPRAGTARRRGPTRRVSRATGAGGTSPSAVPRGRSRSPAPRITPPPRTTHHRIRAHGGPLAPARVRGRQWPDTARLCAGDRVQSHRTGRPAIVAQEATGRADAAEHGHAPGPAAGSSGGQVPAAGAGNHTRTASCPSRACRAPPAASRAKAGQPTGDHRLSRHPWLAPL